MSAARNGRDATLAYLRRVVEAVERGDADALVTFADGEGPDAPADAVPAGTIRVQAARAIGPRPMSATDRGPQVGDRVEVTLTGTVRVRRDGKYPSVEIELDNDIVSAGRHPDDEDIATAAREVVTTFAAPDSVVVIERAGGAR